MMVRTGEATSADLVMATVTIRAEAAAVREWMIGKEDRVCESEAICPRTLRENRVRTAGSAENRPF